MKKIIYIVLFFLAQTGLAQDAFRKSNDLYSEGKYAGAAAGYEGILKHGQESAEVYFNLGNAYYKLGKVAPCIYNYEKALQLNPGNKDILVNLAYAKKMIIDDIRAPEQAGFSGWMSDFAGTYHYDTWAWIAVIFSFAGLLCFAGYYFARAAGVKRGFFAGIFVAVAGLLIAIFAAQFLSNTVETERPAIVFIPIAVAKAEPEATAGNAFTVHEGVKVFVLEDKGNWKKVALADDTVGWLESETIKELQ